MLAIALVCLLMRSPDANASGNDERDDDARRKSKECGKRMAYCKRVSFNKIRFLKLYFFLKFTSNFRVCSKIATYLLVSVGLCCFSVIFPFPLLRLAS
jgi:hypothetical protein